MTASNWLDVRPGEVTVRLRVQPRSKRPGVAGIAEGRLRVRVSEPPTDGRANEAVVRMLAKLIGVPKSAVDVRHGAAAREKTVSITAADPSAIAARLRAVIPRR